MRILLAAAAALLALAGCNRDSGNAQNGAGLPTPPPRPGTNTSTDLGSDQSFRQSYRTINIATCVSSAEQRRRSLGAGPGPDFRAYCTCSVDRLMAGLSVEQLSSLSPGLREQRIAEQCAREHGLAGPAQPADADGGDSDPGDGTGGDAGGGK